MKEKKQFIFVSGSNIKKYRALQRLGQEELGEIIGVSRQTVNTWEAKEAVKIEPEMVNSLLKALKVKIKDLTDDIKASQVEQINPAKEVTKQKKKYQNLEEAGNRIVADLVAYLNTKSDF